MCVSSSKGFELRIWQHIGKKTVNMFSCKYWVGQNVHLLFSIASFFFLFFFFFSVASYGKIWKNILGNPIKSMSETISQRKELLIKDPVHHCDFVSLACATLCCFDFSSFRVSCDSWWHMFSFLIQCLSLKNILSCWFLHIYSSVRIFKSLHLIKKKSHHEAE